MNLLVKICYKLKLDTIWNTFASSVSRMFWKPFQIMTADETLDYILRNKCSVSRYGDGELQIAAYGCALKFQRADKHLQSKLRDVMKSANPHLLLCLPNRLNMVTRKEREQLTPYWQECLTHHLHPWTKRLPRTRCYGDTNISRLTEQAEPTEKMKQAQRVKSLWENRNVIMVEGEKTRFGVGNDLFDSVSSVQRILGPAESAFDYYPQLLAACCDAACNVELPLVLLALGPTATALASDLADRGIQAIDIGHLDISYERLRNNQSGPIHGKYTNEEVGGDVVDDCLDEKYLSEIIMGIGIKLFAEMLVEEVRI